MSIVDLLSNDIINEGKNFSGKGINMAGQDMTIPEISVVAVVVVVVVVVVSCQRPTDKPIVRTKSKEAKAKIFFLWHILFFCAISSSGGLINQ